jgi:hypothetical protein
MILMTTHSTANRPSSAVALGAPTKTRKSRGSTTRLPWALQNSRCAGVRVKRTVFVSLGRNVDRRKSH